MAPLQAVSEWLARMVYDGAGSKAGSLRAAFELIAALCIRLSYWVGTGLFRKSISTSGDNVLKVQQKERSW